MFVYAKVPPVEFFDTGEVGDGGVVFALADEFFEFGFIAERFFWVGVEVFFWLPN